MNSRNVLVVLAVFGWLSGCCISKPRAGGVGGGDVKAVAGLAGRWVAVDVDKKGPGELEIVMEWRAPRIDAEVGEELARLGHRAVVGARVRLDGREAREWIVTDHDGRTYGCAVVPNAGLMVNRLELVSENSLFVGWGTPGGGSEVRVGYRRK